MRTRAKFTLPQRPHFGFAVAVAGSALGVGCVTAAHSQTADIYVYDIPPGPLEQTLRRLADQSGIPLEKDAAALGNLAGPGVRGTFSIEAALAQILAGSGYRAQKSGSGYTITPESAKTMSVVKVRADRPYDATPEARDFRGRYQDSATKSQLSARETPQSISIVTRESIEARQALDLSSAVELVAGLVPAGKAFAGNNPRTGESFVLRGQTLDGSRDIRIDGFTAGGDRNNFDLAPFERVDVVKGPSSMLYGQGSLGGFINLVRKKPQVKRSLQVALQAGSYDTYRVDVDGAGALDADGRVLGQATFAYEDSGSFIDGVDSRRFVIAPSIDWQIGDRTRMLVQALYQDDEFSPSLGIPLRQDGTTLRPPNVARAFFFGVPSTEDSAASALHTTVRIEHELSDQWLATLLLHHSRNRLLGIADSYGYGIDDVGNTYLYSSWVAHDNDNWAGELRLQGGIEAFGREHKLLVGVEKNRLDAFSYGGGGYPYIGTANIYDGSLETAVTIPGHSHPRGYEDWTDGRNDAAYAQLLMGVADRTKILAGLRYDRADINRHGSFVNEQSRKSEVTSRIGVTHELNASLTAYAVYAQSFNPVLDLSRSGILDPETGDGYEVGLKGEWFDGRFGANAALYRQELDNRAIPDPTNLPNESFSISGGLERTEGIEIELTGKPLPGWTLAASATWVDAEYIDRQDPNFSKTPGGTIERQAALYTNYELQVGPLAGFGFGATLLSVGDRIVLAGDNLVVEGYERVDLHVSYNGLSNTRLSLLVRNLTDERYVERPNSAYLYGHFFGSPRAALLRAEYTF